MFSIARYDEDKNDSDRTPEKRQDRINKLVERAKRKSDALTTKEKEEENEIKAKEPTNDHDRKDNVTLDKKQRKKKKKTELDELPQESAMEVDDIEVEADTNGDAAQDQDLAIDPHQESQSNQAVFEVFPDYLGASIKQKSSDLALIKTMGIPLWLQEPTMILPTETCALDKVGLSDALIERCKQFGIHSFFAVQTITIPAFLRRSALYETRFPPGDLYVSAPTGSGKTLAYVLPIVEVLSQRVVTRLRALVILPTRDLVLQVAETFEAFTKGTSLKVGAMAGQKSMATERQNIIGDDATRYPGGKSQVDILVTTPGRLVDHLKDSPNFTMQHLRFLVVDEADRLLGDSYYGWLDKILQAIRPSDIPPNEPLSLMTDDQGITTHDAVAPSFLGSKFQLPPSYLDLPKAITTQKLFFSATLTKDPAKIAELNLQQPEYILVQSQDDESKYTMPAGLEEYMAVCDQEKKPLYVIYLLQHLGVKSALCFTKSVESTQQLTMLINAYQELQKEGDRPPLQVADFSSDLGPAKRKTLLRQFKEGKIDLLVCSDLIGRGIDLDNVESVISYDVPNFMEKYVHRLGRTARAGRHGVAYSLVEHSETRQFKKMLKRAGHKDRVKPLEIDEEVLSSLTPDYEQALNSLTEGDHAQ